MEGEKRELIMVLYRVHAVAKVAEKLSSWPPFTKLLFCDCLHN